jgi:hypothetical protein
MFMTSCIRVLDAREALPVEDSFEKYKEARELISYIGLFKGFSFSSDADYFTEDQRRFIRNCEPFVEWNCLTAGLYSYWQLDNYSQPGTSRAPHMVLLAKSDKEKITGILVVGEAFQNGLAAKVTHFAIARFNLEFEATVRSLVLKTIDQFPEGILVSGKKYKIHDLKEILGYGEFVKISECKSLGCCTLKISREMAQHSKEMECDRDFRCLSPLSVSVSRATTVYTPWNRSESSISLASESSLTNDDDLGEQKTPSNLDASKKVVSIASRFTFRPISGKL